MHNSSDEFSGILLAGGKSTRIGEDKAFLKYNNRFLYEFSLDVLKSFSSDILISSSDGRFESAGCQIISDDFPELGPIGGIYSCLKAVKNKYVIVLPCDVPNITHEIIESLTKNSSGYDITVALNPQNLPEPLIGIYSVSIIPAIEKMIDSKFYKLQTLLQESRTNYVKFTQLKQESFLNINRITDFNKFKPV